MNGQSIFSVKKIKELDDNSPKKTDSKDPKTIAKLVVDGRYSIPYMPEGIYAEIRDLVYSRDRIMKQHNISANRIQRWLAIHFPEYLGLYTGFDAASGLAVLEKAPLPKDVIALGVNGIREIYDYYVTRVKNPLKRRQAMVAVSCKLIRVFYAVLTKGVDYDRFKMTSDIHWEGNFIAA